MQNSSEKINDDKAHEGDGKLEDDQINKLRKFKF